MSYYGISVDQAASAVVENNIVIGGSEALTFGQYQNVRSVTSDYNDLYGFTAYAATVNASAYGSWASFHSAGYEAHGFNTDPKYVNPTDSGSGGNLHLQSSSPLVGQGVNLYSIFTTDADGISRPASAAWDIGAYQYATSTPTYTIGGTISGLTGTVVLQNNGGDNLTTSANGAFTFATATTSGGTYNVTVLSQPSNQTCSVSNGSGTVSSANITSVTVSCTTNSSGGGGGGGGSSGGGGGGGGGSIAPVSSTPQPGAPSTSTSPSVLRLINSSGTLYLIKGGYRYGITSPGILYSYGFDFPDAKAATTADLAIPLGSLLLPGNGYLVKSNQDKTVYLISNNRRYAFVSAQVFTALGFSFSHVFIVTNPELQSLPRAADLSNGQSAHLPGLDINKQGTIYWIGGDSTLHGYPSLAVYNSWHKDNDFSQVVPANTADMSMPIGGLVEARTLE